MYLKNLAMKKLQPKTGKKGHYQDGQTSSKPWFRTKFSSEIMIGMYVGQTQEERFCYFFYY